MTGYDLVVVGAGTAGLPCAIFAARAGARVLLLSSGGFATSPALFQEIEGFPLGSAARESSTGDRLVMARGLGAHIAGRGKYLRCSGRTGRC